MERRRPKLSDTHMQRGSLWGVAALKHVSLALLISGTVRCWMGVRSPWLVSLRPPRGLRFWEMFSAVYVHWLLGRMAINLTFEVFYCQKS